MFLAEIKYTIKPDKSAQSPTGGYATMIASQPLKSTRLVDALDIEMAENKVRNYFDKKGYIVQELHIEETIT